jgi:hypothetical protein
MNRKQGKPYDEKIIISFKDKDDTAAWVQIRIQMSPCVQIPKGKSYPKRMKKKEFSVIMNDAITKSRVRIQLVLSIRNRGVKKAPDSGTGSAKLDSEKQK